jgi:glycine oxidase
MPEIVVVGGGIAGAFTAYFLAGFGAGVTLVERDEIGGQASGRNPGGLNPHHGAGIPGPLHDLALTSFRLHLEAWDDIRRRARTDFGAQQVPRLHIALEERDLQALERAAEPYASAPGFAATWIRGADLRAHEPGLATGLLGGLLTEGNARVDAPAYTRAVAAAAADLGARTLQGEVRDLRHSGGRVTAVVLDSGPLRCDGVAIASGPWCAQAARWLDAHIPVEPVKGEMLAVAPRAGGVRCAVTWRDAATYPAGGPEVWIGGTEDRVGFDDQPSPAARTSIVERISRILPTMADARVVRHTAGLRPVTPDGAPIVGIPRGWENACLVLGAGRKGMLLSAGMGLAAAELLTSGRTGVPVDSCSPDRWAVAAPR